MRKVYGYSSWRVDPAKLFPVSRFAVGEGTLLTIFEMVGLWQTGQNIERIYWQNDTCCMLHA